MNDESVIGVEKTTEEKAEAAAEIEQQQDAVLDKILGPETDDHFGMESETPEPEAKPSRERDESGRFKPKAEAESGDTDEAEQPEVEAPTSESVNSDEYRKALKALTRAKTPQKVLDNMDPADVVEWGQSLADQQAEQDRFTTELGNLKKKVEAPELPDLDIDLESVSNPLVEYLGEDAAEPAQELAKSILKQVQAQMAPIKNALTQQERNAARDRLSKQWSLDDDSRWGQVLSRREEDANDYSSESEALAAACRHCFADEVIADYATKLKTQHNARANGQTTTASRGSGPTSEMSAEDLQEELLNAIQDGDEKKRNRISQKLQDRTEPWRVLSSDKRIGMK